jgi:peptidoglycan/LPS O-acetylase OafA/YrhL
MGGVGRALFAALTFHINLLEEQKGYLPANWDVLWSLSVEEVFYLLFPIACHLLGRGRWLVIFLIFFVITGPFARTVMAGQNESWREYSYLGGMDAIALGCLTAIVESRLHFSRSGLHAVRILGGALMVLVLGFSTLLDRLGLMHTGLDMTIAALGTCLIIIAVSKGSPRVPAVARPLLWFGQRSYEIYLTHMFVVIGLFVAFSDLGKPLGGVPILFVTAILISGLLGEIVARFYSEPMNRILRMRMGGVSNNLGAAIGASDLASPKRPVATAR